MVEIAATSNRQIAETWVHVRKEELRTAKTNLDRNLNELQNTVDSMLESAFGNNLVLVPTEGVFEKVLAVATDKRAALSRRKPTPKPRTAKGKQPQANSATQAQQQRRSPMRHRRRERKFRRLRHLLVGRMAALGLVALGRAGSLYTQGQHSLSHAPEDTPVAGGRLFPDPRCGAVIHLHKARGWSPRPCLACP